MSTYSGISSGRGHVFLLPRIRVSRWGWRRHRRRNDESSILQHCRWCLHGDWSKIRWLIQSGSVRMPRNNKHIDRHFVSIVWMFMNCIFCVFSLRCANISWPWWVDRTWSRLAAQLSRTASLSSFFLSQWSVSLPVDVIKHILSINHLLCPLFRSWLGRATSKCCVCVVFCAVASDPVTTTFCTAHTWLFPWRWDCCSWEEEGLLYRQNRKLLLRCCVRSIRSSRSTAMTTGEFVGCYM